LPKTWPGNGNGIRRPSHHWRYVRLVRPRSAVASLDVPRSIQGGHGKHRKFRFSPCIWPASVYPLGWAVAVSVRIFATLAPAAIRSMATDAHRPRYSRLQSDTPEKYSFPRNNLASESPQGGSHNPLPRITAKGFPLHSRALPAIG
jgi:hypothetical protein